MILKELVPFVNDNDMQASAWAFKVAIPLMGISGPASELSKSHLIQGQTVLVNELFGFFQAAAQNGSIQDKTLGELYNCVSIKS